MTTTEITIKGAREHNLREVSLRLPRGQMICFTGVSGSGKSSLAFDTLYAEGQRRYVESLSNYARQFMGQMPKPDVDLITGLSPAISISQKSTGSNPRSTVGTITEIYDFLRVLYARVGTGHCHHCGTEITAQTREQILSRVLDLRTDQPITVLAPLIRGQKGEFKDLFEDLRKQGYARARVDGQIYGLAEDIGLDRARRHDVEVVIDRLSNDATNRGRLAEAVDQGLRLGKGSMLILVPEGDQQREVLFSSHYACVSCGRSFPPPTPQLFSFNSPQGMCEACDGLGRLYTFVPELLIPDQKLSFRRGAISLIGEWSSLGKHRRHVYTSVADTVEQHLKLPPGTMLKTAWKDLPPKLQEMWLWGTGDMMITFTWRGGARAQKYAGTFHGVVGELLDRYRTGKNKMYLRAMEKYMDTLDCPDCHGKRLNPQACAVTLRTKHVDFKASPDYSLPELCTLSADRLANFFSDIELSDLSFRIAGEVLKELRTRIGFLLGVGLDYLSLDRTAPTLSGGESQRIRLAGQIGSGLSGVLYILDEPSIGLHARDNDRLIDTLLTLRDRGNTLIVVEHDEDTMRAADLIVDFGPGPGIRGGRIVATGSLEDVAKESKSVTGQFLSGKQKIEVPKDLRPGTGKQLIIKGASHNNLKNIDVVFPLGKLICVTGVSGSGKSSLIGDILEPGLRRALNGAECEAGQHECIEGLEFLDKTIAIDQSPIGRTPRSNPGTYVKVFDEIRNLFAQMQDAKTRGYTASRFSFNVDGGRCSACEGNGATKLEMDFLADIWVTCPVCEGHRYNRETLAVKFKEKSIADVLELDVAEGLRLFKNIPKIADQLQTLVDVGLEYLKLGQPSPTLSGGEAQRIKLSRELSKRSTGKTLYVLDEPTTGLHFADIKLLLGVLHDLVDKGNTVVVVEHNLDVIKTADWIIDLGPEGGDGGGQIVIAGTPAQVAACKNSYTGRALARTLGLVKEKAHTKDRHKKFSAVNNAKQGEGDSRRLIVEGASEHNLKSVDVSLPRDAMTVFCGPSGSGKSSLAMDTIYAEGQRRYVESLSSYARQFIGQMQKPHAERIEGLSPAVALEQKNLGHSPRSTVGTVTEIYDYFRILMARLGTMYCPDCQIPVGTQTADQIVDKVMTLPEGTRFLLLAPLKRDPGQDPEEVWASLRENGYARVRIDGTTYALDDTPVLDAKRQYQLQVVIDRLVLRRDDLMRMSDSIEQGLALGAGVIQLAIADGDRPETQWEVVTHSQHLACGCCGRSFQTLSPHHFSFNTAVGWCEQCEGLGVQNGTNPAALLSNPRATLADGVLLLWPDLNRLVSRAMLQALSRTTGIPVDVPFDHLPVLQRRKIYHGTGDLWIEVRASDYQDALKHGGSPPADPDATPYEFRFQFKGLYPALAEASRLSPSLRAKLDRFTDQIECNACDGTRLKDVASAVRFGDLTIGDYVRMPLDRLNQAVSGWKLDSRSRKIAGELVREIRSRLQFLLDVGLDYLTIGRAAATLSGGEAQRIRLASQLGSGLCGVLYVLDEPTIGLHPRDNRRLLGALHRLRDLGNTLLVVEHDFDVIAGSDYLCDFGPKAGRHGGHIVAEGAPTAVAPADQSVTAPYITGDKGIPIPKNRRFTGGSNGARFGKFMEIQGAAEHNLQNIDVRIPLEAFVAVTGPSGSGKSTLINDILYPSLARRLHRASLRPGRHRDISGVETINKVIRVDQSPLGNTPSSNPATYTGLFDLIRSLFAKLPDAKSRGYTARQFSFNVPGGRCEACEGSGQKKIEMHFLPDVWIECEECHGRRYLPETLEIRFHGYNIADCLDMSCGDALLLFEAYPKITRILQTICDVGLDYVTLGQSAPTLSGGEAQRVKLAAELARPDTGRTLYLLDEPTTGLHFEDIQKLLLVLQRLVDLGNTVVVIEHNLDVIKTVDWIIDMGPEAGVGGGQVVCEGTPEEVAAYAVEQAKSQKTATKPKKASKKTAKHSTESTASTPIQENLRSYTGEFLAASLKAGPYETRETLDIKEHNSQQQEIAKLVLDLDPGVKAAWQEDGRSWHLLAPTDRQGQKIKWEIECLRSVVESLEDCGRFAKIGFNHSSTIEISGVKANTAKRSYWFLHAFSCESLWCKLKFRVPKGTFQPAALSDSLNLPTLNQMKIPGAYSNEKRVRISSTSRFQEVEIRLFYQQEAESVPFQNFLNVAIDAYCGTSDLAIPRKSTEAKPRMLENSESAVVSQLTEAREPWQALGRRWHSLKKGFPFGTSPAWPVDMAEKTIELFEHLSGTGALQYEAPNMVTVRPVPQRDPWAIVETKNPRHLSIAIEGPAEAIDLEALEQLQTKGTIQIGQNGSSRITFEFTKPADLKSEVFRTFLTSHLSRTFPTH